MKTANWMGRGLLALAIAGTMMTWAAADAEAGPRDRKLERQMSVMERIMDDMLVDSPNWLVSGRRYTRGTYVEGHGAIFTFDASLVNSDMDYHDRGKWWKHWWGHDDDRVIIIGDDDWDDEDWDDDDDRVSRKRSRDKYFEREMKRQERRYTRGKTEVVDVLVDFGDLLSAMEDSDYIEVEAFLEGATYFYEEDMSRLSVRVKVGDLRAFSEGTITEKTLIERIQTKES